MKLSDTQAIILTAAAQRPNCLAIPLPDSLRGGAAIKVVNSMVARGLLARVPAGPGMPAFGAETLDGGWTTLVATGAGLEAFGVEPAADAPTGAAEAPAKPARKGRGQRARKAPTGAPTAAPVKTRDGTKQAQLIGMLRRKQGATIAQIIEATGWRTHTVRGAFAGALKGRRRRAGAIDRL